MRRMITLGLLVVLMSILISGCTGASPANTPAAAATSAPPTAAAAANTPAAPTAHPCGPHRGRPWRFYASVGCLAFRDRGWRQ